MSAIESVVAYLVGLGLPGIVMIVLMGAIWYMWNQLQKKDDRIKEIEEEKDKQAADFTERALEIQEKVFESQSSFNQIVDKLISCLDTLRSLALERKK